MLGLGITDVYLGVSNKIEKFEEFIHNNNCSGEQVLYMGDDLPDYEVMSKAGVAVCPKDSAPEVISICTYVSHLKGGEGCVRDVIEQTMRLQGKWFDKNGFVW